MNDRIRFLLNRLGERLWVRPLFMALVSVGLVFLAAAMDGEAFKEVVPEVSGETVESLLRIMASSMLVIATFSVGSMVSAYASASSVATPRSFSLLVADDSSQNALSTFIGAFIFSIVALSFVMNSYYDKVGRFALFVTTLIFFAVVVVTFVRWVDRVARLGRINTTIETLEKTVTRVLMREKERPFLGGKLLEDWPEGSTKVYSKSVGYVQQIDLEAIEEKAESEDWRVAILATPGAFITPDKPIASVVANAGEPGEEKLGFVEEAFRIGDTRTFDEDPRFGLIVLSEIASRALSPGVNDPGTAIDIIGRMVRLLAKWQAPESEEASGRPNFTRIEAPRLETDDLYEDAFRPIARDGAGTVEVAVRLQKGLRSLSSLGGECSRKSAARQSEEAFARSEMALQLPQDIEAVRAVCVRGEA